MSGAPVRICDSDNKFGWRCKKPARYPWRKPRLCGQHWTYGERYVDPIVTKPRVARLKSLPSELHLNLKVLIDRLNRLLSKSKPMECSSAGCARRTRAGKNRCESCLRKIRVSNKRLAALRKDRGECSRPGCTQQPASGGKMCARHLGINRTTLERVARVKRRKRHGTVDKR